MEEIKTTQLRELDFLRKIALSVISFCLVLAISDATAAVPTQKYPSSQCDGDESCLERWFREYRGAIRGELAYWSRFASIVRKADSIAAERALGEASSSGAYKHNHWDFPTGYIEVKGASYQDVAKALSCRSAIVNIKFALDDLSKGKLAEAQRNFQFFQRDSKACEAK